MVPLKVTPRFSFGRGDLVQYSRLGIKRQHNSIAPKDGGTKGLYYGNQSVVRGYVYVDVDWYVSTPWERQVRQRVRLDYLEPLGHPR